MSAKYPNVNCIHYADDICAHPFARRTSLFGNKTCIVVFPPSDRRLRQGCAVQVEFYRPAPPPKKP